MKLQFIILQAFLLGVNSWDLSYFGIGENYYVSSLAVYRNRAFVALPRSSCYNNLTNPTLIEVPWIGEYEDVLVKRKISFAPIKEQTWNNCKQLQDVVSVDVERKKGRLWVLDKGNRKCPPKILVYSLFFNSLIQSRVLRGIPGDGLNTLVVDAMSSEFGPRAYVGDATKNRLIVFSLNDGIWWRLQLVEANGLFSTISTRYLAISKIKPEMYITGDNATDLFMMDLNQVRNSEGPLPIEAQDVIEKVNVSFVGNKLGPSAGILADYKQGLNYYLVRDFVVLRWDTRMPLQAEHHDVLAQSYTKLHYVPQLFLGPQNGVWALVNPSKPLECSTNIRNDSHLPAEVNLKSRVTKVLKYTRGD